MTNVGEPVAQALRDRPDLLVRLTRLVDLVEDGRFDPQILAMCRKRVGTILACPTHAGRAPAREELDSRQLACLDFAEMFVLDHHSITDEDARAVTAHLSDAEMVVFTTALALYDGFCRFERTLVQPRSN
jgi:alkylhydroperoxidase family enzyme